MIRGKPFQFVVPLSVQDCKTRIQSLDDEGILGSNRIQFWQADKHTTDYEIKVWRFLNFLGTVSGELTHKGNQLTQVTITTQLALHLKLFLIVYTVLAILLTINDLSSGKSPLGLIFVPWGIFLWLVLGQMCNRVAKSLRSKLT